jgi:hypothetical protein
MPVPGEILLHQEGARQRRFPCFRVPEKTVNPIRQVRMEISGTIAEARPRAIFT